MYMFIWVKTCIYLYIHVHTHENNVHSHLYLFMYVTVPCLYCDHVHTCLYFSELYRWVTAGPLHTFQVFSVDCPAHCLHSQAGGVKTHPGPPRGSSWTLSPCSLLWEPWMEQAKFMLMMNMTLRLSLMFNPCLEASQGLGLTRLPFWGVFFRLNSSYVTKHHIFQDENFLAKKLSSELCTLLSTLCS